MVKETHMHNRIVVIGLGGIGSILINKIARYVNYHRDFKANFLLIDGDNYEEKNLERQEFAMLGNKSEIKMREMQLNFENLHFDSFPNYITPENINTVIQEGDIVFLCVDNHKTRNLVSSYCSGMNDIILLSGGNELTDGNVQLYVRKGGVDVTPSLSDYHPEIETPDDKSPDEMSCEELAKSEPQLYFTNLGVATLMCWAFYKTVILKEINISEVYFDIVTMGANPAQRKPLTV